MISTDQLHQMAVQAINQRNYPLAHQYCVDLVKAVPEHADGYFLLGIINSEVGQFNKATRLIEKATQINPLPEYFAYLAKCLSLIGDMEGAKQATEHVPLEQVNSHSVLDTTAVALSRIGLHDKAIGFFEKVLALNSGQPQYFYNYAVSCKFAGQFNKAQKAFEQAIALAPDFYAAHFALSDLGAPDPQQKRLNRLLKLVPPDPEAALFVGHALAKEYELHGQYLEAIRVLTQAKQQKFLEANYDFAQDKQLFEFLQNCQFEHRNSNCESRRPIFVIGMPRSGTTLVERILTSHSEVASGGELQDFGIAVKELCKTPSQQVLDLPTLQAAKSLDFSELAQRYLQRTAIVGPNKAHFVDKLPFNFFYLPLIRQAFPNAKIICLLRNPMDTCVGNFRQLFSMNSPYYQYSLSLTSIGQFYTEFHRLAHQWAEKNDPNFMLLNYEELATDPQQKVPELIAFCDLQWQPQCLHAEKNPTPVSTASKVQVREPINTKSLGRWKRYKPSTDHLEALLRENNVLE